MIRRRTPSLVTIAVALGIVTGASAFFSSSATHSVAASVGSMNPPSNVTAVQTAGNVAINWSAASLSTGGSVQGYRVKRSDGTTVCGAPTLVTTLSCTDSSAPSGTYTYTVTAVYNSFSASATSGSFTVLTGPSLSSTPSNPSANTSPNLSFTGGGGSGYKCQLDGGTVTSCSSPQTESALAGGSHTFKVHAVQGGSTGPDTTFTWTIDTTVPSITAKPSNPSANAAPSFSFSHTQSAYTFKCQLDGGGFSACTSSKSYSGLSDGSHTFQVLAAAGDGSQTSATSYTWLLEATPPTDSLSLASGASHATINPTGTRLYYNGNTTGSFKLIDAVTDSGSGPASATFPAISTTGWTHNAETVSSGSGSAPTISYTSSTFSWTAGPSNPTGYMVTSKDVIGNTSAGGALAFVNDATPPSGGAVSVNGAAATGSDPVSYSGSTSFVIGSRADYSEAQSATQSGLATSTLTVQSETLSSGTCGAPGSGGPFTTPTTVSGTTQPSGIVTGSCYVYTLTGTDNVGNSGSISTTVEVDTGTPTTPTLSFSGLSGNAYYASGNNTLYVRPASGGTFTVTASSTAVSGIATYSFSSLSSNGFTGTQTGGQNAYTFGSSATAPGSAPTVSSTSNSGKNSGNASYNLVKDATAPSGGAVTVNGTAATGPGSTSAVTNSTNFSISSRADFSETQSASQSGLASSTLTVQSESLSGSTCGALGSGGPFTAATTITGTTQPSGIVAGACYVYTLTGTDNVGNTASVSTTVVDNSLSFSVTTQPSSVTAGTATSGTAVKLTAMKNGATDTGYAGSALTWGGANNSPSSATPTLPANPTWSSGVAQFGITLVKAEGETLTVSDGTRSGTFSPITVNTGSAHNIAWTSVSNSAGTLSGTCFFTCTYTSVHGGGTTFKAKLTVTDGAGNTVSNLGSSVSVTVTKSNGTFTGSATVTIPASGQAVSNSGGDGSVAGEISFTSESGSWSNDTLSTSQSAGYTNAQASFSK